VNPSGRPLFPAEQYTLTCEQPEGTPIATRQVSVARGATATLDLSDCVPTQPPPPPVEPKLDAKLSATVKGGRYRVRIRGKLTGLDPGTGGANCAGKLRVRIFAKGTRVRQRTTSLDATCAYDERFGFRRRDLPKKKRHGRVRRVSANVLWSGATPVKATASADVVKRK
jgi:hypothetical protein